MLDEVILAGHEQSRQTGRGETTLLCSDLVWRSWKFRLGAKTGGMSREMGRGGLDTSMELWQRRKTADAGSILTLEVLEAGLGPEGCTSVVEGRKEEGKEWWEEKEGWEAEEELFAGVFTLRQLVDRPCHLIPLTFLSPVWLAMSRQLPTLWGRKARDLCEAEENPGNPLLVKAPSCLKVWVLKSHVKAKGFSRVVIVGVSSRHMSLWEQDAKLLLDWNRCCCVNEVESSRMVSSEKLLVLGLPETTVLRLVQLPPNWLPAFSASSRDWSFRPITSLMGDSVSSQEPCFNRDSRRHSVERKDDLAGGATEGKSEFFRFPRWNLLGPVTYPQNTESRWAESQRNKQCRQSVSASKQQGGGKRGGC